MPRSQHHWAVRPGLRAGFLQKEHRYTTTGFWVFEDLFGSTIVPNGFAVRIRVPHWWIDNAHL